jgi:hypothetical protein
MIPDRVLIALAILVAVVFAVAVFILLAETL